MKTINSPEDFANQIVNNQIHIQTQYINTFRNVHNFLEKKNIPFFPHFLPSERKLKVLIRGVPILFIENQIKENSHMLIPQSGKPTPHVYDCYAKYPTEQTII